MLKKIQVWFAQRLQGCSEEQISNQSLHLAAAILMLEVARSDFEQDPGEQEQIALALKETFELEDQDVEALLLFAQQALIETVSLYDHVKELNEEFSYAQKIQLIEQLWRVAYADGRIDKYEDYTVRKLSDLLYVAHRDFISAKHRAEQAVVGE